MNISNLGNSFELHNDFVVTNEISNIYFVRGVPL